MAHTITIVNPAAEGVAAVFSLAPRLPTLQGARVGVVNNSKHMAAEFLAALEIALRKDYPGWDLRRSV
jgi:hypothetical protein